MKVWQKGLSLVIGLVFGSLSCGSALRLVPGQPELAVLLGMIFFFLAGGISVMMFDGLE